MKKPSDLNVTLHQIDENETDAVFPEDLSQSDLLALLKFSTERAADEVFWMKANSEIFYVNNTACKKLGYERHELIGKKVWEWDPLFPKEVWPTFWKELKEKKHIDFETQHQSKQGQVFPVRIKGHYFEHNKQETLFAYVSDISDIKDQEAKLQDQSNLLQSQVDKQTAILKQEKKKFEEFVNLAPIGIAINRMDDGSFLYVNSEFSRFTGYSVDELNAMDYWQLTPRKYEQQEKRQLDSMAKFGCYGPYQKEYIHKKGHTYPVLLSGIEITDIDDKQYIWSVIQDVSVQKENEEHLKEINEHLKEAKNEAVKSAQVKSQFLANMSHEIRTPMNGIVGLTNLLLNSSLNQQQLEWAQGIKASTDSLLTIINDILDISKIESGKLDIESVPFDLTEMVRQLSQPFEIAAKEKSIAFTVDIAPLTHTGFIGDPTRIKQVINNLVNNAIKFTELGSVHLKVEQDHSHRDQHPLLTFTVSDTGIGIPAPAMEMLFLRFTQADSSTTRNFGGTGLGLSICKQLAELMNGEIKCESTEGEGSTFSFCLHLPIAKDGYKTGDNKTTLHNQAHLNGLKVLLVEDIKMNQVVAQTVLEGLGMHVDVAENGIEAVAMVSDQYYDLIFMDCHMPKMDGFEATRKIKSLPGCQDLPIVALTAGAMKEDHDKCIASGMHYVITKPFEPSQILEAISSLNLRHH